jgi:hypothetical protein
MSALVAFRKANRAWFEKGVALRALLEAHGVSTPHELDKALSSARTALASAKKRVPDFTEEWVTAPLLFQWFFPKRTVLVDGEPFGACTEKEAETFYGRVVESLAKATEGEWKLSGLKNGERQISFKAFGTTHVWDFEDIGGGSDADGLARYLAAFSKKYLKGGFVQAHSDSESSFTYLEPAKAATALTKAHLS